tara:strand:- start:358 stop:636 length:279 start_codon:yes stop_codon:yes gene_type:complete
MDNDDNIIPFGELGLRYDLETGNSDREDLSLLHERLTAAVSMIKEVQYIAEQWEKGLIDDNLVPDMYQAFVERVDEALYIDSPDEEWTDFEE